MPGFPWLIPLAIGGANKMDKDGNYIINPNSGKQMKDENGKKVFDENGKPVINPKTLKPYPTVDNIYEIAALPEGEEKTRLSRMPCINIVR